MVLSGSRDLLALPPGSQLYRIDGRALSADEYARTTTAGRCAQLLIVRNGKP